MSASRNPDFERMWRDLAPIGRSASSGGYFRQPWLAAELELRAWFREAAGARGLAVEEDPYGNLVAWWEPVVSRLVASAPRTSTTGSSVEVRAPASLETTGSSVEVRAPASLETTGSAVLTGSHLDSVLDGGAFDGPLGVVSSFAALDLMRERGVTPRRRLGVAAFVEEEGSRFGRACLGSRLATGAMAWEDARGLVDRDGVRLGDVVAGGGRSELLADVGTYVELHVEQGRALIDRDAAVGIGSAIWPHGRFRLDISGRADHAGSTRMEDRADPMLTFAAAALAASEHARLAGQRATFGRVEVAPNSTNAVPSAVTAWLDARADSAEALSALVAAIEQQASERAGRDGTRLALSAESVSGAVDFDVPLRDALAAQLGDAPVLPSQAGHDAGILQEAGIATAMLSVRNPSGVSHSPAERAETPDCLAGVEALADALSGLVR